MKNSSKVIVALVVIIICCMGMLVLFGLKIDQQRTEIINLGRACNAVVEYCDSTADTGQMDDFIQSGNGQEFWAIVKQ